MEFWRDGKEQSWMFGMGEGPRPEVSWLRKMARRGAVDARSHCDFGRVGRGFGVEVDGKEELPVRAVARRPDRWEEETINET